MKAPLALTLSLLFFLVGSAAAQTGAELERSVLQVFEQRCASCHYEGERNGRKGKKPVLTAATSLAALRRDESYVLVGKPAESPLFRLLVLPEDHEDRMPQNRKPKGDPAYVPPLPATEVAVLRQWIEADGSGAAGARRFVSDLDLLRLIAADLEKLPAADRADTRYLTLHSLRNLPAAVEPESDLEIYRAALSKLLNSLSWQPGIVRPVAVNPERTVFRVKLADYGWNSEMWHKLSAVYPYGLTRLGLDEWKVARLMATDDAPFLRADWFVFAASQPPLYHDLLFWNRLPQGITEQSLESYLQLDTLRNLREAAASGARRDSLPTVLRAGFKKSGVSQANRLIERHQLADGRAYWKSYDFSTLDAGPEQDLFLSPLGPPEARLSGTYAFEHDGGEIIFHLPNGLQGYLLTTADGKVLSRAPEHIVQDQNRRDRTILNGISCMKCHDQGTKNPVDGVKDDVKAVALRALEQELNPTERTAIERLYAGRNTLEEALTTDSARFLKALAAAGAAGLPVEPVAHLYERFKADLRAEKLASEFNLDEAQLPGPLAQILADSHDPAVRVAANISQIGLPRREFIPKFQAIVAEFRLGQMREFGDNAYEEFGQPSPGPAPKRKVSPRRQQMASRPTGAAVRGAAWSAANPLVNTLGMKFVPVPGTDVLFSIWETRRLDYEAYANAAGGVDGEWRSPGFAQEGTHPVVNVSWEDAQKFAAWLTEKERREGKLTPQQRYRLPTDVEWSRAVGLASESGSTPKERDGGVEDVFPWGTQWPPPRGAGNYDSSLNADAFERTSPAGSFLANQHGLFDLGGNVWEWCEDYYDGSSGARVLRGASFYGHVRGLLLSSTRNFNSADNRNRSSGFRMVLVGAGVR